MSAGDIFVTDADKRIAELEATIAEQKDSIEGGVLVATALNSRINLLEQRASAQKSALGELRATKAERDALVEAAREAVDSLGCVYPENKSHDHYIGVLEALLDKTREVEE